jgi:7-carboxy-7-deazaguanine synthase
VNFDIVEKFVTLSGEAPLAGRPMYLVRFSGCNLDCGYCDTAYRNEVNQTMDLAELTADIRGVIAGYPAAFVLLTGGEPLLGRQAGIAALAAALPQVQFYVETNGSLRIEELARDNLRYVVDWKCASAGPTAFFEMGNLSRLRPGLDCLKLVVAASDLPDLPDKLARAKAANPGLAIWLSPQWGAIELDELAAFIVDHQLDAGLSLQLHKIIWGNKRGV